MNADRLLATCARVAVRLGWAILLLLGAAILFARAPADWLSRAFAWLSAILVLAWLAAHLHVRRHGARGPRRDLDHELAFALAEPGHRNQRKGRRAPWGFYRHRSHGGERPRFD